MKDFEPPLFSGDSQRSPRDNSNVHSFPKLLITVLNGGKDLGSKVKFTKFYLIVDVAPADLIVRVPKPADGEEVKESERIPDVLNIYEAVIKVQQAIEKGIASTKAGLAAFKKGPDGSYYNAFDGINECFKLLEDAINGSGVNSATQNFLRIGVNTDARNWFLEEAGKYEWDGPKNQMEPDQLGDFYEKMCGDHPLLSYIEDGFCADHITAFKNF